MAGSGFNKLRSCQGVTFLELLVTLAIIFILASVALPITKVSTKRAQELELRQTLRTGRTAIAAFRRDWAREGDTLLGPLCVKNQLARKENTGLTGYPKSLEQLLKIELTGAEAQVEGTHNIRRYLRRIPLDPLAQTEEWGLRCYQDDHDEDRWCGEDVFDLYTTYDGTALDKTKYRDW